MNSIRSVLLSALLVATVLLVAPAAAQDTSCDDRPFDPGSPVVLPCPELSVEATASPTSETSGTGTFTITRSFLLPDPLVVHFQLGGTAIYGTDYTSSPAASGTDPTVTFASGEDTVTVTITPLFDLVTDTDTVVLTIMPDDAYNIGADGSDSLTIPDFAHNTVSVSIVDAPLKENNDPAIFRLTRDGDTAGALTVRVQMGGDALQGASGDYTASPALGTNPTTISIPTNQRSVNITLSPVLDSTPESLSSITLVILSPPTTTANPSTHYVVGAPSGAIINLEDDDRPTVTLAATDSVATESGATTGTFTLTRNGPTDNAMPIVITLTGTATQADNDYSVTTCSPAATCSTLASNQVQIAAGQLTATVVVRAVNDTLAEVTETVILSIDTTSTAYNVPGASTATISIEDDDNRVVTLAVTDATAGEPSSTGVFTITRSGPGGTLPLQVRYTISGTANHTGTQKDYAVTPANAVAAPTVGRLNFSANEASKTLTITPIDDSRLESSETVKVTLELNGTAYGLGTVSNGTVTIADNDTPITDGDGDGVLDAADNCPTQANGAALKTPDGGQNNTDADALGDACDPDDDNDGLTDAQEATHGTKQRTRDTDGDGRSDGDEVTAGTKPLDRFSPEYRPTDLRAQGTGTAVQVTWKAPAGSLVNRYLVFRASDPTLIGTAVGTGTKTTYSFNDTSFPGGAHEYFVQAMLPTEASSLYNSTIARTSSDAKVDIPVCEAITKDSDGDGLCDVRETTDTKTDPTLDDTDGDGRSDGEEVADGTDPLDAQNAKVDKVSLAREGPFWIGLVLVIGSVAIVAIALVMARRGPPAPPSS